MRRHYLLADARGYMFALGGVQALKCNKNAFPAGVTTHDQRLQRGLDPEHNSVRAQNFIGKMSCGTAIIVHSCGVADPRALKCHHCPVVLGDKKFVPLDRLYPVLDLLLEAMPQDAVRVSQDAA